MKVVIIRGGGDEIEIILGQKTQIDSSLLNESVHLTASHRVVYVASGVYTR